MNKLKNLEGMQFGRLFVVERDLEAKGKTRWICDCSCGRRVSVLSSSLLRGSTKSCGCFCVEHSREMATKHNGTGTRLYNIWSHMVRRCRNESDKAYKDYGGRGIRVCDEWNNSFTSFRDWSMANGYKNDLSIDRIDNDGNYCPENCRWATMKVQSRNTRQNVFITYNGETKCVSDWAISTGLAKHIIHYRIHHGWTPEKTLTTPSRIKNKSTRGQPLATPPKTSPASSD